MSSFIYCFFVLIATVLYIIPFTILFFLTYPFDRERLILHWASRFWAQGVFFCNPRWRTKIEGLENIDRSKTYVIVTNHQSMMDVPLMYVLPLNFKWVSKKEVLKMPIFGWVLRMHGDITIERGSSASTKHMFAQSDAILARGTSVIIFPEGTRTKTGRVGRFKEGAFVIAKSAGVGILPVVAEGTGSVADGWKIKMPHNFTVRVLPPVSAEQVAIATTADMASKVCEQMTAAHKTIRPDLYVSDSANAQN